MRSNVKMHFWRRKKREESPAGNICAGNGETGIVAVMENAQWASVSDFGGVAVAMGYNGRATARGYLGVALATRTQGEAKAVGEWGSAVATGTNGEARAEGLGQQGDRTDGEPERGARSATEKPEGLRAVCDTLPGRRDRDARRRESPEPADGRQWAAEPGVGRVVDGLPCRVERIRALGNAVVPQQAYPIFRALAEELRRR